MIDTTVAVLSGSTAGATSPRLTWDIVGDIDELWRYSFMVNAFRAGTVIALAAGVIGYFVVLRRQAFVTHALANVGFPGAAGATLLGISTTYGYFSSCLAAAVVIALLTGGRRRGLSEEPVVTGTVLAVMLGLGYLFAHLYHGNIEDIGALLFGTFLGVTDSQVVLLAVVSLVVVAALASIGRPLLFASLDPRLAAARGISTRGMSLVFLLLLGAVTAEASQITGVLLVFALLVMPAAAAHQFTSRPGLGVLLSALIAFVVTWFGLTVAYFSPYPLGFFITTAAFAVHLVATLVRVARQRLPRATRVTAVTA